MLLLILVISFRSRAVVFCQYLYAMTGIKLRPADVRTVFRQRGRDGVRELFLDLIIREDLKHGPLTIPGEGAEAILPAGALAERSAAGPGEPSPADVRRS